MTQGLRSLMLPVQLDRGCKGCHLYMDADDTRALCYVEEWKTPQDLDREIRSERFTRLLSVMESASEPPTLEFLFVSRKRGLDYVEEVRPSPQALRE